MTDVPAARLLTSDIFDTAVMRLVGRPPSAFVLLGRRLRASGEWAWDARAFAIQRAQAEVTAAARAPGGEPGLADIYAELAHGPFLVDADRAMAAELDLERALIVPSGTHAARLEDARAAGTRIGFVSDTYFPSTFLREILGSMVQDDEAIYASCELGRSKHAGTVFARVMELEGEPPSALLHIGDNRVADGTMARRSGVTAELCEEPALNRYEAVLERRSLETEGASSLLAGAARVVRATSPATDQPRARRDVAASVAAPVLTGFVAWTLEAARAAGCTRIGYVSRDGQILHAIATRLESQRPATDRLHAAYIHGGRRAWHPAGLTGGLLAGEPPRWWLEEARRRRWQAPLDILGLDEGDVPTPVVTVLRSLWERPEDSTWAQTVAQRKDGLRALWADPEVQDLLRDVGARSRSLLCRYLTEHGMGEGRWALVDVGWRGHSAASLNRALTEAQLTPPLHLYMGLLDPVPELTTSGDWQTYLFCTPGPDAEGGRLGGALTTFVEVLCSADHGSVAGFREGAAGVEPVLDPPHAAAQAWGIGDVQAAILEVVDRLAPFAADLAAADLRPALLEVLQLFLEAPDPAEAAAWSTFPFTDDPAGITEADWVAHWSAREVVRWALRGAAPRSFWPQASLAMSPAPARALVAARTRLVGSRRADRGTRS